MKRWTRLLIVIGALAVVGVGALAYMAKRYADLARPMRSVMDVEPAPEPSFLHPDPAPGVEPAPAGAAPAAAPAGDAARRRLDTPPPPAASAEAPAARPGDPAPVNDATPATPAAPPDPIEGFVAGRRAIVEVLDSNPRQRRLLVREAEAEESGGSFRAPSRLYMRVLADIRVGRAMAAGRHGMTEEDYHRVRAAYDAWKAGDPAVDPELTAAFERRAEELAELDLGVLEVLDR